MVMYIVVIGLTDILMIAAGLIWGRAAGMSTLYVFLAAIGGTIGVIAWDGLWAFIIRRAFPEKWFSYERKGYFDVPKKECKFYEKLGIKKWKDHVLELGMFTAFDKKAISDPDNPVYMERFILENNYGEVIHLQNAIVGIAMIFCFPLKYFWYFSFPIIFVNAILSLMPYAILRYNTPRLQRRRLILVEKAAKKAAEEKSE